MLQTYNPAGDAFYEGQQTLGLSHYFAILKRRWWFGFLSFTVVLLLGAFVTAIQRPLYQASGKVLIESQDIPADLVKPTVIQTANERVRVIQQRIMTRENLMALVNKYQMFARERRVLSDSDIIDLLRQRTDFQLVTAQLQSSRQTTTIAFTVTFDDENPQTTLRFTNDLLTLMLAEDARNRTSRATETTNFLTRETERLRAELQAIEEQIAAIQDKPSASPAASMDPAKSQQTDLTKLKEELAQEGATHSDAHPAVVALKKKIASMEQLIANSRTQAQQQSKTGLVDLQRRQLETQKALEENNKKLAAARLGEKLERDQQSERLQVIEQPVLPQDPVKPNRFKFLALAFGLAMAAAGAAIVLPEAFDKRIHSAEDLFRVANGRSIVSLPLIATRAETSRRRSRLTIFAGIVAILLIAGLIGLLFFGPPIDIAWLNQMGLDRLRHLAK
jgi:protein tyrosine kinase modulator